MKKTVIIVGGSAGATIAAEIFKDQYGKILFLETYSSKVAQDKKIGDTIKEGLNYLSQSDVDYFIATGDNQQRRENYQLIYKATKKNPVNCIHPSAVISSSSTIGFGNLICPLAVIHVHASIGNNTIINTSTVIEHDCLIEDYAQVSPNVTLCGYVSIRESSFIGAGSVIIPKITIGKRSIIAAGSSVIKDVEDDTMYAGVPAIRKKSLV